jgi:hypothetical protein
MKPFTLIQKSCKTQKEQLEVCESLINHFVGSQEAQWSIDCNKKHKKEEKIKSLLKKARKGFK